MTIVYQSTEYYEHDFLLTQQAVFWWLENEIGFGKSFVFQVGDKLDKTMSLK